LAQLKKNNIQKINGKIYVFIFCLLISAVFWFLQELANKYSTYSNFHIEYVNAPVNKIIINKNKLPRTIKLKFSGSGFSLLKYSMKNKNSIVYIDLNNIQFDYKKGFDQGYFLTNNIISNNLHLNSTDFTVNIVSPDTIFFSLSGAYSKVVPVKIKSNIKFEEQYTAIKNITINPKVVRIFGPKKIIDTINNIETNIIKHTDLSKSINGEININSNIYDNIINVTPNTIKYNIPTIKYTEKTISLPLSIKQAPKDVEIKLYPKEIKVKVLVGINDFDKIKSNMFSAVVIFNKDSYNLVVSIEKHPEIVKIIDIEPNNVEYLILK